MRRAAAVSCCAWMRGPPACVFLTPPPCTRSTARWDKWERWSWEQSQAYCREGGARGSGSASPRPQLLGGFQESIFKGQVGWGWVGSRRVFDQLVHSSLTD